ncbi:hypothetical protein TNCV_2355011 [Trichonephila clavipes]|nr:hypothetical protein TNCV_2355011 [Trichonephila clavipes]
MREEELNRSTNVKFYLTEREVSFFSDTLHFRLNLSIACNRPPKKTGRDKEPSDGIHHSLSSSRIDSGSHAPRDPGVMHEHESCWLELIPDLLPSCLTSVRRLGGGRIGKISYVSEEVDFARQINLEVNSVFVQELLDSHNQDLTVDELMKKSKTLENLSLDPVQLEQPFHHFFSRRAAYK